MNAVTGEPGWTVKLLIGRWPLGNRKMRPADISDGLLEVMLSRNNLLEDANYSKIVPNHYIIEVNSENYASNYRPIERQVLEQWNSRLLNHLLTTNSRYGRKAFRFGGKVQVEIRPVPDLEPWQARIFARIQPDEVNPRKAVENIQPCLVSCGDQHRWHLHSGVNTIGRDTHCDIALDSPAIRETRLISGYHAYVRIENTTCRIYDGSPAGKPSLNGTFLNRRPVPVEGAELMDGDQIILAASDLNDAREDTQGVAVLYFTRECI